MSTPRIVSLLCALILLFSPACGSETPSDVPDSDAADAVAGGKDTKTPTADVSQKKTCSGKFKIEDLSGNPTTKTKGKGKSFLFDQTKLHHIKVEMEPADWKWLRENALKESYVPAKVVFDGKRYYGAAVRYKGDWSSLLSCFDSAGKQTCKKLSLKLRFSKYDKCGRFHGLRRVNFNSSINDKSLMRDRVSWNMMRGLKMRASQSSHALVSVNGVSQGLFVMVEGVDKEYLEDHFDNPEGNLYKQVWPSHDYAEIYTKKQRTNEDDNPGADRLIKFAAALKKATPSTAIKDLTPFVDLKRFSRNLAVHLAMGNFDGPFMFLCWDGWCVNNNYYIYDEPGGQIAMLPWDMDNNFYRMPQDFSLDWWTKMPASCEPVAACTFYGETPCPAKPPSDQKIKPPPCEPLLRLPVAAYPNEYLSMLKKMPEALTKAAASVDVYKAQIAAAVAADTFGPGSSAFEARCKSLQQRLKETAAAIEKYLKTVK